MKSTEQVAMVELKAFTYNDRWGVLPDLAACWNDCGGWLLERRAASATSMEFRIEVRLENILDLYGSLMATGIELTCHTHATLTDLCTCRRNKAKLTRVGSVVMLRLMLHFQEQVTVPMLLATGCATA